MSQSVRPYGTQGEIRVTLDDFLAAEPAFGGAINAVPQGVVPFLILAPIAVAAWGLRTLQARADAEQAHVVALLVHHTAGAMSAAGFAYLCAVAYHRYDLLYRQRDTGVAPPAWLSLAGLGVDGRLVVLLAIALLAPGALVPALWAGAAWLAVLYAGESAVGWRSWIAAQARANPTGAGA